MVIHVKGKSRILHVWVSKQNVHREALLYELSSLPFYLSVSFSLSIYLSVCVSLSLSSPLSCSLSHTSLYSFLSSYLYLLLYLPIAPREYICLSLSTYLSPSLSISLFLSHPSLRLCLRLTTLTLSSLSIPRVLSYDVFFLNIFSL